MGARMGGRGGGRPQYGLCSTQSSTWQGLNILPQNWPSQTPKRHSLALPPTPGIPDGRMATSFPSRSLPLTLGLLSIPFFQPAPLWASGWGVPHEGCHFSFRRLGKPLKPSGAQPSYS